MATAPPYPQMPVLETSIAVVVLVVNIFLPGIGTIVAGVVGKHKMIGRGVVQFLTWWLIVGWVWAIITGVQCLTNAKRGTSGTA